MSIRDKLGYDDPSEYLYHLRFEDNPTVEMYKKGIKQLKNYVDHVDGQKLKGKQLELRWYGTALTKLYFMEKDLDHLIEQVVQDHVDKALSPIDKLNEQVNENSSTGFYIKGLISVGRMFYSLLSIPKAVLRVPIVVTAKWKYIIYAIYCDMFYGISSTQLYRYKMERNSDYEVAIKKIRGK